MLHITEDTPADMLAGSMELVIHLPSGKTVKMFAERSTPMMDMLVQITTNNHLQITNYVLQPLQTFSNPDQSEKVLTYYPNTPIGTLDTQHIRVVSKTRVLPAPKNAPPGHQPFESTFRLKVHLPRNQLYVTRVSRNVLIEDIMRKVCEEKDLDPNKYEVRHPGNLTEVLDPKLTLNDYMITEIHLMIVNSKTQTFTSNDIISLKQDSGRKQHQPKTGGVFNLIFKKNKSNTGSGPFSAAIHSIFTTRKETNKSHTASAVPPVLTNSKSDCDKTEVPKPPQRKRRPAPKPPQIVEKIDDRPEIDRVEMRIKPDVCEKNGNSETNLTICHSRHSSDSSGYHETSFLSDQCNTSLPRIGRLKDGKISKNDRRHTSDFGNRMAMTERSRSTPSLVFPGRKKKAAPSPPTFSQKPTNSPTNLEKPSPVVASLTCVGFFPSRTESTENTSTETIKTNDDVPVATFPAKTETEDVTSEEQTPKSSITFDKKEKEFTTNQIERCMVYEKFPADSGNSSDISEKSKTDYEVDVDDIAQINDQVWQLPSPPKAFKDSALNNRNEQTEMAQKNTVIVPELITKLKVLEEEQERNEEKIEKTSDGFCDEQPIHNKLSLEHLEKRKTLVYNRELATSLKSTCNSGQENNSVLKKYQSDLELSGKLNEFIDMLEDIRKNNMLMNEKNRRDLTQSTLPNFKITTYDEPKQKVKVFEDDTIRSNSTVNLNRAQSLQKIYTENNTDYIPFKLNNEAKNNHRPGRSAKRSESFSSECNGWSSSNPVTRSKSQIAMKKRCEAGTSLSKTNSLYDISGLQSLGVMKKIQNKLNTPSVTTATLEVKNEAKYRKPKSDDETIFKKRFSHPASINICTWSERSKIPVNTYHDGQKSNISPVNLNQTDANCNQTEHQTLRIKINESDSINTVKNGNILIKIGGENDQKSESDFTMESSDFHVSRIPVVRSVELKKNLKESGDTTKKITKSVSIDSEPILSKTIKHSAATLKNTSSDDHTNRYGKKFSSHMTLPLNTSQYFQPKETEYTTNQNVPFSTFNLRSRTESKNSVMKVSNFAPKNTELNKRNVSPQVKMNLRKNTQILDPRAELLKSIQEFGGKNGLKSRRA